MSRTFLALTLSDKLRQRLQQECDRLRLAGASVAWTKPEDYQITLRFFGETNDEDLLILDPVISAAAAETKAALRLVAKGLGTIPESETPRTVVCGLVGEEEQEMEELVQMRKRLDRLLRDAGWRHDKGGFLPHITLGRVRDAAQLNDLRDRMGPAMRREFGHFVAHELTLFETVRTREGMEHNVIRTFTLGK